MSLPDYVEWLEQYPAWFKSAIFLWILATALLIAGFLFLKRTPVNGPDPEVVSAERTEVQVPIPELSPSFPDADAQITPGVASAADYFATLQSLQERFHERQEFVNKHRDAIVEWQGFVDNVSEDSRGTPSVHLTLSVHADAGLGKAFSVQLPISMRTKAFALRQGDLVVVRGKLYVGSAPTLPYIYSQRLERHTETPR